MKIAEALLQRSQDGRDISDLQVRLRNNTTVQEGDSIPELPTDIYNELTILLRKTKEIAVALSKTNAFILIEGFPGVLLCEGLAHRDMLKGEIKILRETLSAATQPISRYSRTEIKSVSTVNVKDLRKRIDTLSQEYRILDVAIQKTNWQEDLLYYTPAT